MSARAPMISIRPLLQPLLAAAGCAPEDPILIAVSGGGDSMALLLLAHEALPSRVHAATVDHALRDGSSAEAERVALWSSANGIPHRILRWEGEKPASAVQMRAREARYALLARTACEIGSPVRPAPVVAAHTLEDQAETFAMRLSRGSGLTGLAAMRAISEIAGAPPVPLLRPLLGTARADLRAYLRAQGQAWIEDPSNEDTRFERIRVRNAIGASLPAATALARAASLFSRLDEAFEPQVQNLFRTAVRIEPEGFARLDRAALSATHPITMSRGLARLLRAIGGGAYPPPPASVMALIKMLGDLAFRGATLGGCRLIPEENGILIVRERRAIPITPTQGGDCVLWDRRFFVCVRESGKDLAIAPLGTTADGLREHVRSGVPAAAAAALPGLFRGDRLVAPAILVASRRADTSASRFVGLARVQMRLCEAWADWALAQISPTVS